MIIVAVLHTKVTKLYKHVNTIINFTKEWDRRMNCSILMDSTIDITQTPIHYEKTECNTFFQKKNEIEKLLIFAYYNM